MARLKIAFAAMACALLLGVATAPAARADDGNSNSANGSAPKKRAVKGKSTKEPKGMKAKHLTGEATLKGKDQKNVDFEAADIGGERKTPMGTLINQNKADKNYDFVKIRLRWHPEMVQSASALDTGNSSK